MTKSPASEPARSSLDQRAGHDLAAFRVNIPTLRFRGWLVLVPISVSWSTKFSRIVVSLPSSVPSFVTSFDVMAAETSVSMS